MLAVYADHFDATDPLAGLATGERPDPVEREGWTTVTVRATSLNHHDLWSLRGVGLRAEQLPMILGTDAAGVTDDGREVVLHGVIGADGHGVGPDETRTLLSEKYPGTFAERVSVPTHNLVDKPAALSFEEAACLPTAWLTAYRMLFRSAELTPGQSVLVQGAGGGLATAAIALGAAAGLEVIVTSRSETKRSAALALGASHALEPGARVPHRVDAVLETVGAATWSHSVRSVRPGGIIAVAGATSGDPSPAELTRIFFNEITVRGTTMGTRDELVSLLAFLVQADVRPTIDGTFPIGQAQDAFARLASGAQVGKIVLV
ncbi:zinc-binding dehydrogenase [Sanguibacter antarcticus]|uniref:NADPH:quinone reductase-like Zn-dependent oxidoreductase n=1 Tax=Sanguibacter antarcticus TaxID=372484 RepID=A0A2A9EAD8_9MICO|nr:zinc-binding dehydrogenase [Sanguibacter antarcticus]PFG35235.1 NADPH:quinone reductase-like Zn-dependent oxidoreductase [Sanguibacter antarcticus]